MKIEETIMYLKDKVFEEKTDESLQSLYKVIEEQLEDRYLIKKELTKLLIGESLLSSLLLIDLWQTATGKFPYNRRELANEFIKLGESKLKKSGTAYLKTCFRKALINLHIFYMDRGDEVTVEALRYISDNSLKSAFISLKGVSGLIPEEELTRSVKDAISKNSLTEVIAAEKEIEHLIEHHIFLQAANVKTEWSGCTYALYTDEHNKATGLCFAAKECKGCDKIDTCKQKKNSCAWIDEVILASTSNS